MIVNDGVKNQGNFGCFSSRYFESMTTRRGGRSYSSSGQKVNYSKKSFSRQSSHGNSISRTPQTPVFNTTCEQLEKTGCFPALNDENRSYSRRSFSNEKRKGRLSFPVNLPDSPERAWWKQTSVLKEAYRKNRRLRNQVPTRKYKSFDYDADQIGYLNMVCKQLFEQQKLLKEKLKNQDHLIHKLAKKDPKDPLTPMNQRPSRKSKFPRDIFSTPKNFGFYL